ncbi:MAG: biotin/lipoyl-binding protein [Candidatus Cloacimonetes bacterium]|nr:biotin/lipoyl-binding protein [Candidatus Cloacimonadota bacterium]
MKTYKFKINGDDYQAKILEYKGDSILIKVNGIEYKVEIEDEIQGSIPKLVRSQKTSPDLRFSGPSLKTDKTEPGDVTAPIPGLVHKILVAEGDRVNSGDPVIILEAMKMESEITTDKSGIVKKILVKEGGNVQENEVLLQIGD